MSGAVGHILWLGEVQRSSPYLVNFSCALVGLVLVPPMCFCWAASLSISLQTSIFPISFFLFLRPCLILARLPEMGRAFVSGNSFLHSWSRPMTLVVGLLHMELRSCPIFLLFSSRLLFNILSLDKALFKLLLTLIFV